MAAFNKLTGDSARADDIESIYPQSVVESGVGVDPDLSAPSDPNPGPAQESGGEGTPSVVGSLASSNREHTRQEPIQNDTLEGESRQATHDPAGKQARYVTLSEGLSPINPERVTPEDRRKRRNCFKKHICNWRVLCLTIIGGFVFATAIVAAVCWFISQHNQEHNNVKTTDFELLQSDTILAYSGKGSSVEFSARFEVDSDDSTRQLDVRLIAVNCDDLIKRNSTENNDIRISFTGERPIYEPPYYHHYEIGSTFDYSITSQDVPASSGLDIRIFDNTTEADFYKSHHDDPIARDKAIWMKSVTTNKHFSVSFKPSHASYFISTFDPRVDGGAFEVDLSYSVNRIYYSFTDYAAYTLPECTLNSTEPCSFDIPHQNEICVLAYNPPSTTGPKAVLLSVTTSSHKHARKYYLHNHVSYTLLGLFVVTSYLGCCLLCCFLYSVFHKTSPVNAGYQQLLGNITSAH